LPAIPQVVQKLKSLSSVALLAVSQLRAIRSKLSGISPRRVMPEPRRLDEAAAQWRRRLLVLAGEIVFADRPADLLEHRRGLALWVQRLAPPPGKAPRPPHRVDRVRLVLLGDRREAHDLPIFLGQHVADRSCSCSRCMISSIAPFCLSLSRL
jgi:hypothetical protein